MEDLTDNVDEEQDSSVLSRRTTGRSIADIDALSKADIERLKRRNKSPQRLQEIEQVINWLIELKEQNRGTLRGTGARNAAAAKLNVCVETIDNYIAQYEADPRLESFIDKKRGRNPGGTFPKKQQEILAYYYKNPTKQIIDSDGKTTELKGLEDVRFMQLVLKEHAPEPSHSDDSVRRFLRLLKQDDALVVVLARRGENYVTNKILPARRNDPDRANDRWQIDARPLPIYIKHDGLVCTVTLLLIIDDLSQYPIRARLIPRKLRDEKGLPKNSDFTAADVGILFASAIHYSGVYPGTLYNDHGSQLIAIEDFLNDLSEENKAVVKMSMSIPRRPRGRGKIENLLKMFDELLKDIRGNLVGKERDFIAIREARTRSDLLSLEDLQMKCDEFINQLRDNPRRQGEKRTRRAIWSDPEGVRKAPPIRRLMTFVPERVSRDTAIDYWHFQFDNQEYEPRLKGEEDLYRWMVAAVRKEFVPLRAAKLDAGWECDICLGREDGYWCDGVLKTERYLPKSQYPEMLGRVLTRAKREHASRLGELRAAVTAFGLDKVYKHEITKQPVTLSNSALESNESAEGNSGSPPPHQPTAPDASGTIQESKHQSQSSVSVRTAPARKAPEAVKRKFDWTKAPKAQDTQARIESEMQQDKENS